MNRRRWNPLLCALLLCALLSPAARALEPAPGRLMAGVDVSVYQGDIDFEAVREDGVEVVYIRAGYGDTGVDAYCRGHYGGAEAAGLKTGFYYYMDADTEEGARRQAEHFISLVRDLPADCRPAMDFEVFGGLDAARVSAVAVAFLEAVENGLGQTPMVYSDIDSANRVFDGAVARWPLWVAEYGVETPGAAGFWDSWAGWQYTDRGSVSGIRGDVDRDWFTPEVLLEGGETYLRYTVRAGDTLWGLSRRFGTTVEELVELNDIPNPDLIYVGQTLLIPRSGTAPDWTYTVRPGDTLWGLSRRFGTTVEELVELNNIPNPDLIYVGQTLLIP